MVTNKSGITASYMLFVLSICDGSTFNCCKDLKFSQEDNSPYEKPDDDLCEKIVEQVFIPSSQLGQNSDIDFNPFNPCFNYIFNFTSDVLK